MRDGFLKLALCASVFGVAIVGCDSSSDSSSGGGGIGGGAGGAGGAGGMGGAEPAASCAVAAADATQTCLSEVNAAWNACYQDSGTACAADDPAIIAALGGLESTVTASCTDGELLSLDVSALVGRLQTSCSSEATSLASRSYGGPQGAVWADSDAGDQACVQAAQESASNLIDAVVAGANDCLASESCVDDTFQADVAALAASATQDIGEACGALQNLIALTPEQYVDRAVHQSDCVIATAHQDTAPLMLSCGPQRAGDTPVRGEYVQIVLDGEEWGTICGDGSPFAFQLRLAPEGQPLDRVLIGMQGGGVCVFEADCTNIVENAPGLLEALDDQAETTGIMSNDPGESPFADWTKVYLPYCNQDVYTGGGITQPFTDFTIERYGAINVRAAVQYVRNLLWRMLDEEGGNGYRPDEITAAFGGWSAGGFGTLYNYHWVLDDLQWPNTAGFPDASLGLDSGGFPSVGALGAILVTQWAARSNFPPYCFAGNCAVGPTLYAATAPRLKGVPNQQLLILTNQNDSTQVSTTFFPSTEAWINAERTSVCDTRDLDGIQYYLTSSTDSVHVVSTSPRFYSGSVDGEVMSDWIWGGVVADPDNVVDRMEEGDFQNAIEGVNAFPCAVAP